MHLQPAFLAPPPSNQQPCSILGSQGLLAKPCRVLRSVCLAAWHVWARCHPAPPISSTAPHFPCPAQERCPAASPISQIRVSPSARRRGPKFENTPGRVPPQPRNFPREIRLVPLHQQYCWFGLPVSGHFPLLRGGSFRDARPGTEYWQGNKAHLFCSVDPSPP